LPDSCLVYLSAPDFFELNRKINGQSLVFEALKGNEEIRQFCWFLGQADSLFSSLLHEQMEANPVHFALYGGMKFKWLTTFNTKQLGRQNAVEKRLQQAASGKTNRGTGMIKLAGLQLFYTVKTGIVSIANSEEMINAILEGDYSRLADNPLFKEFESTLNSNSDVSIYVNHALYNESAAAGSLNLSILTKKGFSAGNIVIQPSQLKINGFLKADSTGVLSVLENEEAQDPSALTAILPVNTICFKAFGFGSFANVQLKLLHRTSPSTQLFWKQVNAGAMFNLKQEYNSNAGNYFTWFKCGSHQYTALKISDTAKAREHLGLMSDSLQPTGKNYRIRHPGVRLFEPLCEMKTSYATIIKDHIIFSEEEGALNTLQMLLKNDLMITGNESFQNYSRQQFPEAYNFFFYCHPNEMEKEVENFFSFRETPAATLSQLRHFSYTLINHSANFKFRLHLQRESPENNNHPNFLWCALLDTACNSVPCGFINHQTGENELVVQDEGHKLYLVNAKGAVIWKKRLDEKITSRIFMVDALKNKKYQLLFSTKNYLHLIDRVGRYVDGFPVKLPAAATAPLAVVDYEDNGEYRLLVPCADNTIYNYDIAGKRLEGFTVVKTAARVKLPVQFVKVGDADYLMALDTEGRIYAFNRKGAPRMNLTNRTTRNCAAFYLEKGNSAGSTWLVYVDDKNALINKIAFNDKKEISKLDTEIDNAYVDYKLIDDNRRTDVLVAANKEVIAYDLSGNRIFAREFNELVGQADYFSDEAHSLCLALNAEKEKLLVFDILKQTGKNYRASAMPYICDLFNDRKKYLIFPDGKQVNCILIH
jgi:hypothetical protein